MSDPEPETQQEQDEQTPKAHQPDGSDSSASFEAGIADENTIPEAHPS